MEKENVKIESIYSNIEFTYLSSPEKKVVGSCNSRYWCSRDGLESGQDGNESSYSGELHVECVEVVRKDR